MRVGARPLGYLSLHEQKAVTRHRAASGILAFQGIAAGNSTPHPKWQT
jgi:hypothetical protein